MPRIAFFLTLSVALAACPAPSVEQPDAGFDAGAPRVYEDLDDAFVVDGERPVTVRVPTAYDGTTPLPFLLLLHGYGIDGAQMESFTDFRAFAEDNDLLYASPDGTIDSSGREFWNASPACCDFAGTGVDDSGYLRSIIDAARERANIDPGRIFVVGHSNGGFMAHRLACDHADVVAAIVSLAGAVDEDACAPSQPVAVLQVHGTADDTILYEGGSNGFGLPAYPGAVETASTWASLDDCDEAIEDPTTIDVASNLTGAETRVTRWSGCTPGGASELWTVEGGGHVVVGDYLGDLHAFLSAHAR